MAQNAAPTGAGADIRSGGIADQAKGAAQDVAREAQAAGSSVRREVSGLGSTIKQGLSDQVERQRDGIADRLNVVAERVQQTAGDLREHEAWLGNLLGRGAAELQSIADEIRRNDVPGILGSVEVFARRQPALFMGATVALGFALTRVVSAGPVAREPARQGWRDEDWNPSRRETPDRDLSSLPGRDPIASSTPTRDPISSPIAERSSISPGVGGSGFESTVRGSNH